MLAAAGVVDAGAAGYLLLLDAFLHVVDGRPLPIPDAEDPAWTSPSAGLIDRSRRGPAGSARPRSRRPGVRGDVPPGVDVGRRRSSTCGTAPGRSAPGARGGHRRARPQSGDSVVVTGRPGCWTCHVHTDGHRRSAGRSPRSRATPAGAGGTAPPRRVSGSRPGIEAEPLTFVELDRDPRVPPEGRGAPQGRGARRRSACGRWPTCSPSTRAATSTAPARRPSPTSRWARRRPSWPRSCASTTPADPPRASRWRRSTSTDGSGSLRLTFFNQGWRARQLQAGRTVVVFGRLETLPGPGADGEPGRRPDRRPDRAHRARLPPVGEGGPEHLGDRAAGSPRRCGAPVPGASPIRSRPRCSTAGS